MVPVPWGYLVAASAGRLLLPAALAFPDLRLTLPNYRRGIFILWVQLCPPLGVGDGLFLLAVEILMAIGHPHIPLCLVLEMCIRDSSLAGTTII